MTLKNSLKSSASHVHVHGPDCGHDHGPQPSRPATKAPATPLLLNESQFDPMPGLTSEDKSKDELFVRMAFVADAMLKAHGKDFTMGTLVLAARFIAEGKPLIKRKQETEAAGS